MGSRTTFIDSESTLSVPFNFEKTLQDIVKGKDEAQIQTRTLGVFFENLGVVGLGARETYQSTTGSMLNPMNIVKAVQEARHPHLRNILTGFDGVVRPGEMLLVLGRPGAGCTTFLKTLANQTDEFHEIEGVVCYDSLTPEEIATRFKHDLIYTEEDDIHFPSLSVNHTIEFAAEMRTPQTRVRVPSQSRKDYKNFIRDMYTTVFGLKHAGKTPVGDAVIRGVSGGEKKRVSISEALASRGLLNAWDNSTRGLDASTALEFVQALRATTDINRHTTIVSLYQAGESLYELFDKVAVVYEGRLAYFGPAKSARSYFIDMGYEPVNRQTTADFLTAITDSRARIPRSLAPNEAPLPPPPRTAAEFAEYYRQSSIYAENKRDMELYRYECVGLSDKAEYYRQSVVADHAKHTRDVSPYTVSIPMQVRAVMKRRLGIITGNWAAQILQIQTYVLQGVIIGTTFLYQPQETSSYYARSGFTFFTVFLPALFTMAEIPALFAERAIVVRQKKSALYHPFVEAISSTLLDVPVTFATIMLFAFEIYIMVHGPGHRSAGQFFTYFLILFTAAISMKAFFRALAAGFRNPAPAQALGGLFLLELTLYTGYLIPIPSMIGALKWISYINPLRYAYEAAIANEFHPLNGVCTALVPTGPGYENITFANQVCTILGSQAGEQTVSGDAYIRERFDYSHTHLWRNYGIFLAFGIFFIAGLIVLTEMISGAGGASAITLFKRGTRSRKAVQNVADDDDEARVSTEKDEGHMADESGMRLQKTKSRRISNATAPNHKVFSWQNINYTVPIPGGTERQLLDNISGYCAPGKLLALMGESGAGKTTLLNVLANRAGTGVVSGDRFIDGQTLPADFQAQTGYCQQTDTHLPTQTVREALQFSARLRQPESVSIAEKDEYAERCLEMCGMVHLADAIVGSLGVEHRKRTTIGVELAAKPQLLLFLDEPTSGLDSQSAWAIMQFLRDLADQGQAILCTIHQPSAELFQVFDRLLLLKKGGQTVYFGDLGYHAETLINYFERNGSRRCFPNENPAEFILSVVGAGATATADRDWHDVWKKSDEAVQLQNNLEDIYARGRSKPSVGAVVPNAHATSWLFQTKSLVVRGFSNQWRDPEYLIAKLFLSIFAGLFIGFTFWKSEDSLLGLQNKLLATFMLNILSSPLGSQITVPFIQVRDVYEIRERPSRMYSWTAFITAHLITEIPWNVVFSIICFFCWYWTIGYNSDRAGYTFLGFAILFPMYYATFALVVAAMSPTAEIAGLLFGFLLSFCLTFNGITVPPSQLGWWKWMHRISPYTYFISGVFGQVAGHQEIVCAANEYVTVIPPSSFASCGAYMANHIVNFGGYLLDPNASTDCQYCSARTTDQFLEPTFDVHYSTHWRDIGIFCAYIVLNTFAVYVMMYLFRIRKWRK